MEDLVNYFKNILSNDITQSVAEVPPNDNIFDPELDADITLEELKSAVFYQNSNSSYGLDNICSEAIKTSSLLFS